MKQVKTIYLFATTKNLNTNLSIKHLKYRYKIVGSSKTITHLYNLSKDSIDYLIIFANRKRVSKLDKHMINFLRHIFRHIIVVAKTKVNILQEYTYIPESIANNSLYTILKSIENGLDCNVCYTYDNFYKACCTFLDEQGINSKHKGYQYIIDCAYNIATLEYKGCLKILYQNLAQKYNATFSAIERSIRSAICCAKTKNNIIEKQSNKKFIEYTNAQVIKSFM